jgi:hypothetical protein
MGLLLLESKSDRIGKALSAALASKKAEPVASKKAEPVASKKAAPLSAEAGRLLRDRYAEFLGISLCSKAV